MSLCEWLRANLASYLPLHVRRNSLYTPSDVSIEPRLDKRATSRSSATRSATRKKARRSPMTTSGSGAIRSVHCGGTEQNVLSSTCSRSRLPYRLNRSPAQTNDCPLSGWNGCVTRTRRFDGMEESAFWAELQTYVSWQVSLLARATVRHIEVPGSARTSGTPGRRRSRRSPRSTGVAPRKSGSVKGKPCT